MNRTGEPTDLPRVNRLHYCKTCGAFNGLVPSKREALNNSKAMGDDVEIVGVRDDSTQSEVPKCGSLMPGFPTVDPFYSGFEELLQKFIAESPPVKKQSWVAASQTRGANDQLDGHKLASALPCNKDKDGIEPRVKLKQRSATKQTTEIPLFDDEKLDRYWKGPDKNKLCTCLYNNCNRQICAQNVRRHVKAHLKGSSPYSHSAENFNTQRKHKTLDSSTRGKRLRDKKLTQSGIGLPDSTTLMNKRSKRRQG